MKKERILVNFEVLTENLRFEFQRKTVHFQVLTENSKVCSLKGTVELEYVKDS